MLTTLTISSPTSTGPLSHFSHNLSAAMASVVSWERERYTRFGCITIIVLMVVVLVLLMMLAMLSGGGGRYTLFQNHQPVHKVIDCLQVFWKFYWQLVEFISSHDFSVSAFFQLSFSFFFRLKTWLGICAALTDQFGHFKYKIMKFTSQGNVSYKKRGTQLKIPSNGVISNCTFLNV